MSSDYCLFFGGLLCFVLPDCGDLQDVPLHAHVELWQVYSEVHHVRAFNLTHVAEINLNNKLYRDSNKREEKGYFYRKLLELSNNGN